MDIENQNIEYKQCLNDKFEREVVGFLNSKLGGDIYIGIADDGQVVGIENADAVQLAVTDRLKNNILPSCLGLFDVLMEERDGKSILHIHISAGQEKPYYIRQYGMSPNGCYLRVGAGLKQMDETMISSLFSSRTRTSLRNIPSIRYGEHSFLQLRLYYQEHGFEVNDSFLQNLDLYTPDGKLNMVAFLLADQNSLSVRVAKYAGTDKCDLIENEEYGYCSLLRITERLLEKINIENRTLAKITPTRRLEKRLVDPIAIREALLNALLHNDYTMEEGPIVEFFSDRVTITSYGGLVNELTEDEFFQGRSVPRNRELMRIFKDMDWGEHLGSGMHRILEKYSKDIYEITPHFVTVTFCYATEQEENGTVNGTVNGMVNVPINVPVNPAVNGVQLTERQQYIYNAIAASTPDVQVNVQVNVPVNVPVNGTVNAPLLATLLEIPLRTIKRELYFMRDLGLIQRVGSDKTGHWEVVKPI